MTLSFDASTLIATHVFMRLLQAFVLFYVWRTHRDYIPTRDWALGSALSTAGLVISSLRGFLPLWVSVLAGNPLLMAGWMIFDFGIIKAAGGEPFRRVGLISVALSSLALAWFLLGNVNYPARVLAMVLSLVLFDGTAAWACLRFQGGKRAVTFRLLGVLLLLLAGSNILRAVDSFEMHLTTILSVTVRQVQFAFMSTGFTLMSTFVLLMLTSQKLQEELDREARHDGLTNAFNRRAFEEFGDREWSRAQRYNYPLAVLIVDLDHFKQINDRFGHKAGDRALVAASDVARSVLRPEDIWCRYGGEEFVTLLPHTDREQAWLVAERLRSAIEEATVAVPGGPLKMTASVGVAQSGGGITNWRDIVDAADQALYRAKAEGRNRVVVSMSPQPA